MDFAIDRLGKGDAGVSFYPMESRMLIHLLSHHTGRGRVNQLMISNGYGFPLCVCTIQSIEFHQNNRASDFARKVESQLHFSFSPTAESLQSLPKYPKSP